jgi:hypothetical protein
MQKMWASPCFNAYIVCFNIMPHLHNDIFDHMIRDLMEVHSNEKYLTKLIGYHILHHDETFLIAISFFHCTKSSQQF